MLFQVVKATDLKAELEAANRLAARTAVGRVPLHAAAIETTAGVIAFTGPSGAGKSTLTAAAVRAGYGYVADEITAVSPHDLSVIPFHRPIGLRRGGARAIGVEYPDVSDGRYDYVYPYAVEGHGQRSAGGTLAGIAIVDRLGEEWPAIADLDGPQALVELCEHAVVDDDDDLPDAFARLDTIVRAVPVVRMTYRTTEQSLTLLAELVERWTT